MKRKHRGFTYREYKVRFKYVGKGHFLIHHVDRIYEKRLSRLAGKSVRSMVNPIFQATLASPTCPRATAVMIIKGIIDSVLDDAQL